MAANHVEYTWEQEQYRWTSRQICQAHSPGPIEGTDHTCPPGWCSAGVTPRELGRSPICEGSTSTWHSWRPKSMHARMHTHTHTRAHPTTLRYTGELYKETAPFRRHLDWHSCQQHPSSSSNLHWTKRPEIVKWQHVQEVRRYPYCWTKNDKSCRLHITYSVCQFLKQIYITTTTTTNKQKP